MKKTNIVLLSAAALLLAGCDTTYTPPTTSGEPSEPTSGEVSSTVTETEITAAEAMTRLATGGTKAEAALRSLDEIGIWAKGNVLNEMTMASYTWTSTDPENPTITVEDPIDTSYEGVEVDLKATGLSSTDMKDIKAEGDIKIGEINGAMSNQSTGELETVVIANQHGKAYVNDGNYYLDLTEAGDLLALSIGVWATTPSGGMSSEEFDVTPFMHMYGALPEIEMPIGEQLAAGYVEMLTTMDEALPLEDIRAAYLLSDGGMRLVYEGLVEEGEKLKLDVTLNEDFMPVSLDVALDIHHDVRAELEAEIEELKELYPSDSEETYTRMSMGSYTSFMDLDMSVEFSYEVDVTIPEGLGGDGWLNLDEMNGSGQAA